MGLNLYRAHLRGAIFDLAYLNGANLNSTDLREASFHGTAIAGAYMKKANLTNACLSEAR